MGQATILLADDEPHITHVMGSRLERAGYHVLVASDGQQALALATEHTPDLVVTDLQMPFMSGIDLATALAEDDRTSDVPVIMLTARGYVLDPARLSQTNIRSVLSKPFAAKKVLSEIESVLGTADPERQAA